MLPGARSAFDSALSYRAEKGNQVEKASPAQVWGRRSGKKRGKKEGSAPYEYLNPTVTPIYPFLPDVGEQPIKATRASIEHQSRQPRGVGHINLQLYRSAWSMWNHGGGTCLLSNPLGGLLSSPGEGSRTTRGTAQIPGAGQGNVGVPSRKYSASVTVLCR